MQEPPAAEAAFDGRTAGEGVAGHAQATMRRRHRRQWWVLAVALGALAAVVVWLLLLGRSQVLAHETELLRAQVRAIDRNLGHQLKGTDAGLRGVLDLHRTVDGPEAWVRIRARMAAVAEAVPGIYAIDFLDAAGSVVASTRRERIGLDGADWPAFQAVTGPAGWRGLHVSPPFRTDSGIWSMALARSVPDRSGGSAGALIALLDADYVAVLLGSVNYTPDMFAGIGHDSGMSFQLQPHRPELVGVDLARAGSMARRHLDSGQPETTHAGRIVTGEEVLLVMRSVRPASLQLDHAFVVATARDHRAVLAPWRKEAAIVGFLLLLIAATAALALVWMHGTDERHLRETLERQAAFERLTRTVPGAIGQFVLRPDGSAAFPFVSDAIEPILGLSAAQLQQSAAAVFARMHPDDAQRFRAQMLESARRLTPFHEEFRIGLADGSERWIEVSSIPARQPDGSTRWDGITWDASDRHAAQEAIVAREAAERASRAKSEFMSRMSHELRTPLNAILGFSELLALEQDALTPRQRERIGHIRSAGAHLLALITDLLDISRIEAGGIHTAREPLPAAALVDEALALVREHADASGVTLQFEPAPQSPWLLADRLRMRQVLFNLLSNAIKYNRRGGRVRIDLQPAVEDGAARVRIAVADTGSGLDVAQLAHLFEPFNRLGAERSGVPGTGIGLVITQRLVQLMEGRIDVTSRPGAGSTFTVTLPAAPAAGPAPTPAPAIEPAAPPG